MNNLASKLRNSVSKAAIAASRVNKKRTDADPDTVASRLTKESRGRIGKRDAVDVDKLGAKLAKMPKVDQKTIRAVEARLSPVEAGQLARVRDAKPVAASAAARAVTKANTPPPSAASLKMVTSVEAGELARRGGDIAAYAAAKQNMTPVQKGEYARMLDTQAIGARSLTRSTVNPALNPTLNPTNVGAAVAASNLTAATTNPLAQPAFGTKGSIVDLSVKTLKAADSIATDGVQPFAINSEGVGANGELRPQSRSFFSDVGDAVKDFGKDVGDAFKELGNTIVEGAEGIADVFNGGGSGGDNGPEQSLGEFITTLPQVAFDSLGSAANFLSVSPVWVAKDLVEGFDEFIVGPVADAANAARDRIVAAFEGTTRLLTDLVSGEAAKNFLAYAGTGTEWGEHMVNLLTDPSGATGFAEGFAKGVGESVLDMATQVGKMAQLVGDESFFGRAGDAIRGWAGEDNLPPWLDEAIPSEERGEETIQATYDSLVNLGNYISSRAKDPRLLLDDFKNYFGDKWESLKGEWEAAHAAGPRAEGEFFGKIAGKALFEIALNFVPGKALMTVAEAATDLANFSNKFKSLPDGSKAEALPEFEASLDAQTEAAQRVTESGYATDEELAILEESLKEVENFDTTVFGSSEEIMKAEEKKLETELELQKAIETGYSLATPNPSNKRQRTYPAFDSNILDKNNALHQNMARITPHTGRIMTSVPVSVDDVALLTKSTGTEYALFQREVTNPDGTKTTQSYIVRGDRNGINLEEHEQFLNSPKNKDFQLVVHSHTSNRISDLKPSQEDADFLANRGQETSLIVNPNGRVVEYSATGSSVKINNYDSEKKFNEAAKNKKDIEKNARYTYTDAKNGFQHTYETDSEGRVVKVTGNLKYKEGDRKNSKLQTNIGKEGVQGQKNPGDNDIGFHLIGDQFYGGENRLNIVPGNVILNGNRKDIQSYGRLEQKLHSLVKAGKNIEVQIEVKYDPNNKSNRPDEIIFKYREVSSGRPKPWQTETFRNEKPQGA